MHEGETEKEREGENMDGYGWGGGPGKKQVIDKGQTTTQNLVFGA